MDRKPFTRLAVWVFSLISAVHVLRLFFGWEVVVEGRAVPLWVSLPGAVLAGGLAFLIRRELRR